MILTHPRQPRRRLIPHNGLICRGLQAASLIAFCNVVFSRLARLLARIRLFQFA